MKIHIMGASCAGSTTLGNALSEKLSMPYLDTDDYFWAPSTIPYTVKRDPAQRIQMLTDDLARQSDAIVGGSLISWGETWKRAFDLVVFLYVPPELRLKRLVSRELERYGELIYTDPECHRLFQEFMAWAAKYEDINFTGRNIRIHEDWLKELNCPVLEIKGDTSVEERVGLVLQKLLTLT